MSSGRVYDTSATSVEEVKARVYRQWNSGDLPAAPSARIYEQSLTGSQATQVTAPASQTGVEPGVTVSVTATVTPQATEEVFRTNLLPQTAVQGSTVGSLWSTAGISGALTATPGYRRFTLSANQTGTSGMRVDSLAGSVSPGDVVSAGAWVRASRATTFRVYVVHFADTTTLSTVSGPVVTVPADTWTWVECPSTTAAPATTNRVQLRIYPQGTTLLAGDTFDVRDDVTAVKGTSVGGAFNGSTPTAGTKSYRWTGTPGDSTSEEYGLPVVWAWRQISGPTAQIFGTTGTVQITTPFALDTATLTFGVRATVNGVQSAEQTFSIEVLGWAGPWIYQGGSSWAGTRPKVVAA